MGSKRPRYAGDWLHGPGSSAGRDGGGGQEPSGKPARFVLRPGRRLQINGDTGVGITILLLWLLALVLDVTVIGLVVGVPLGLGMFIWGLIDAYQGAQRCNARHGIIS